MLSKRLRVVIWYVYVAYYITLPAAATLSFFWLDIYVPENALALLLWMAGVALVGVYLAVLNMYAPPTTIRAALLLLLDTPLVLGLDQWLQGADARALAVLVLTDCFIEFLAVAAPILWMAIRQGESKIVPGILVLAALVLTGLPLYALGRPPLSWVMLAIALGLGVYFNLQLFRAGQTRSRSEGGGKNDDFGHILIGLLAWIVAYFVGLAVAS